MAVKDLTCIENDCGRRVEARNRCRPHYRASLPPRPPCSIEGCDRTRHGAKVCHMHLKRFIRTGSYADPVRNLGQSAVLPGYVRVNHGGYVRLARHNGDGTVDRIMEHRAVMEKMIGRPLLESENVHHINGDRGDNRPENLELWSYMQPTGQRIEDKVAWAKELLALYEPEALA